MSVGWVDEDHRAMDVSLPAASERNITAEEGWRRWLTLSNNVPGCVCCSGGHHLGRVHIDNNENKKKKNLIAPSSFVVRVHCTGGIELSWDRKLFLGLRLQRGHHISEYLHLVILRHWINKTNNRPNSAVYIRNNIQEQQHLVHSLRVETLVWCDEMPRQLARRPCESFQLERSTSVSKFKRNKKRRTGVPFWLFLLLLLLCRSYS